MLDASDPPSNFGAASEGFQPVSGGLTASDLFSAGEIMIGSARQGLDEMASKGSESDDEELAEAPRNLLRHLNAHNILSPYPPSPPAPDPLPDDLRVKVYLLNSSGEWDDQGTGYIHTRTVTSASENAAENSGKPDTDENADPTSPLSDPTPPAKSPTDPPEGAGSQEGESPPTPSDADSAAAPSAGKPSADTKEGDPPPPPLTDDREDSPIIGPPAPPEKPRVLISVRSEHSESVLVPEQDCATLSYEMQGGTIVTWAMRPLNMPEPGPNQPDFDEEVAISFQDEDTFKTFMNWLEYHSDGKQNDGSYDEQLLPTPTAQNITQLVELWPTAMATSKDGVVKRITDNKFFPALVQVFKDLEDFDQFEELRIIHALVKNFLVADQTICRYLASDINVADTIALLEYAPLRRNKDKKADTHRQFIAKKRLELPEEIRLPNSEDLEKLIVYQFRLQYLKEEVVYGQLPELHLASLTAMIHQNNQVIFNNLIRDRGFLDELINRMKTFDLSSGDPTTPEAKKVASCFDFLCELIYRVRGASNVGIRAQLVARLEGLGLYNALAATVADPRVLPSTHEHTWLCVIQIMNGFFTKTLTVHMLFNQTTHPSEGFRQYLASWTNYRREKLEAGEPYVPSLLSRIVDVLVADMDCKKGLLLQITYLLFQLLGCDDLPGDLGSSNVLQDWKISACSDIVDFFTREEVPKLQKLLNRRWSPTCNQKPRALFHQQQLAVEMLHRIHQHYPDKFTRVLNNTNTLESIVHLVQLPNGTAPPPPASLQPTHTPTNQTPQELFASRSNLLNTDKPSAENTDEELTSVPKPGDRAPSAPSSPTNAPTPQHEPLELAPGADERPPKRAPCTLACIRLIRALAFGNDPNMAELIATQGYLKPICELLIAEGTRDSLLRASIRNLLDQLNASGSEPLLRSVVSWKYEEQPVCKDTFERFKAKVKNIDNTASLMHAAPTPALNQPPIPSSTLPVHSAWQQSGKSEDWFFEEDGEAKVDGPGGDSNGGNEDPMSGRRFMPPKRHKPEEATNLLIHKAGTETPTGPPSNGAVEPFEQEKPAGTAPAKKPGIVSFSFKPKKRKRGGALFSANKRKRA